MRIICSYLCIPPSQHSYAHRTYRVTFYYFTYFGCCAAGQAELAVFIRVGFFPLNNFTADQAVCLCLWEGCAHCEIQGAARMETHNSRLLKIPWAPQGFGASQVSTGLWSLPVSISAALLLSRAGVVQGRFSQGRQAGVIQLLGKYT